MTNSYRITIIGDGAMGTLCAILLQAKGHQVTLWSAFADQAKELAQKRENATFLPGFSIPAEVAITADNARAFSQGPDAVINAVPCQYMRGVWAGLADAATEDAIYVSITKGIENGALLRPSQILSEIVGCKKIVAMSGPSIAREVARGLPASLVAASKDIASAKVVQEIFSSETLRIYTNTDIKGVELAGAMKNVIALAAGVLDGLNAGDNCKAALLTRGLVEITRLGTAMGADVQTFTGLAGLGDLVTTCISPHGRNRRFGEMIGKGMTLKEAQQAIRSVVEGVATTESVLALATRHDVQMPITQSVHDVICGGKAPSEAIRELMLRQHKCEF